MAGAACIAGLAGCTTEPEDAEEEEEEAEDEGEDEGEEEAEGEDEEGEEEPEQEAEDEEGDETEDDDDEADEQYTLVVTVEDGTGSAAEHAAVVVEDDEGVVGGLFGDGEDVGRTNTDGEIETRIPPGEYTVTAEDEDGEEDAEADVTVDGDEEVTLVLGEEQYTLVVTVEDGTGSPIEHAGVTVEGAQGTIDDAFGDGEEMGQTNTNGRVETRLPLGEYTVTAEFEDEVTEEDVAVDGDEEVTLTIGEDEGGEDDETDP